MLSPLLHPTRTLAAGLLVAAAGLAAQHLIPGSARAQTGFREHLEQRVADLVEKCRYFEYDGVDFTVSGASLQLVNGTGVMDQRNGKGNLVVGYGNDVSGSHNIVIGHGHEVSPTGCLVVGRDHRILDDGDGSTITGGTDHMIRAPQATIRGGERSVVELEAGCATIVGGHDHVVHRSAEALIVGGSRNEVRRIAATGLQPTILGGSDNRIDDGERCVVVGGGRNRATNAGSVCIGGDFNLARQPVAVSVGGFSNIANGLASVVAGGSSNETFGHASAVHGGIRNTASGESSTSSGGADRWVTDPEGWVAGSLFERD